MLNSSAPKIKIVYVITKAAWGGAGRYVYDLATQIDKNIFDVTVVSGGEGLLNDRLKEKGIKTIQIPELGRDISLVADLSVLKSLRALFEEISPDVIHLNSSKIGGIGAVAGRLAKVPKIIFTAHGWAFNENRGFLWKILTLFASWFTLLLAHTTITISYKEESQALAFPFVTPKKVVMAYIGVEKSDFIPHEEARQYIQGVNKKTPAPGAIWIGSIGELHKNKGHIHALEMCKLMKAEGKEFFYFIIGEGEEKRTLEKYIIENKLSDNVALLGHIPDPTSGSTLMKAFDIFLLPSTKEGLPYVLLEAALAGRCVVSTRVGGIPEIITHKETGLLVGDIVGEVFAHFVGEVFYDERIRSDYGEKLNKVVSAKFNIDEMVEDTKNIYLN
jgi:glycosyltransferase involved in cell wall biosynthesis